MCLSHDKLRHSSTLDGMGWDGMGWDGDLTGWDWTGRDGMGWDGMCAPELAAGAPRLGEGWHTQVHVCLSQDKLQHPSTLDGMRWDEMGLDGMGWDGDLTGWDWT